MAVQKDDHQQRGLMEPGSGHVASLPYLSGKRVGTSGIAKGAHFQQVGTFHEGHILAT